MKTLVKIVVALLALIVVAVGGLSAYIATLDADKYRPQLVQTLSEKTGRKVELKGPIAFSLGLGGIKIAMSDAVLGNASWGTRPAMATLGKFEIEVAVLPFLSHKVELRQLIINKADILLETNAAGKANWDFTPASPTAQPEAAKPSAPSTATTPTTASASASPALGLSIGKLSILDSQISTRGPDGKTATYRVESLSVETQGSDAVMKFKGNVAGTPMTLAAKTGMTNLLSKAPFPFEADLTFGALQVSVQGTADLGGSRAEIAAFRVTQGNSTLSGKADMAWGGRKPMLRGSFESSSLDLNDFTSADASAAAGEPSAAAPAKEAQQAKPSTAQHMFSDTPLPFEGLRSVDAEFSAAIDKLIVKRGALEKVEAKLVLSGGVLTIAPVKAAIGKGSASVQVRLDAAQSPARLNIAMTADKADLGELQKLGDMAPFMSGNAGADVQLAATGNTPHALASTLNGIITVTAEKGEILGSALSGVSSALASVFNPGGGDSAINCLAVRFIAKNGVLNDNGILIDSVPTTLAGKGGVNLGAETVDLTLRAKTKLVDVGGFVPALQVGGSLASPSYSVDAVSGVKNVVGGLLDGNLNLGSTGVPEIQTAPAGQNACIYTLDHPKAASSSSGTSPADVAGKASQTIQNLGNSLSKSLFGK